MIVIEVQKEDEYETSKFIWVLENKLHQTLFGGLFKEIINILLVDSQN